MKALALFWRAGLAFLVLTFLLAWNGIVPNGYIFAGIGGAAIAYAVMHAQHPDEP